ncbi:hypothetical protein C8J57DRAFT_1708177, partial [Mycena rebaudengoi]
MASPEKRIFGTIARSIHNMDDDDRRQKYKPYVLCRSTQEERREFHRNGTAGSREGVLIYSPNSVTGELPSAEPLVFSDHTRLKELLHPRIWVNEHPWIPFLPLHNHFSVHPTQCLETIIIYNQWPQNTFQLHPDILPLWIELEEALMAMRDVLARREPKTREMQACVTPPVPSWSTGYRRSHKTAAVARFQSVLAREKILFNLAYISYHISLGPGWKGKVPSWFADCKQHGISEALLSSIMTSWVGSFEPSVRRVGVLRDLQVPHADPPDVLFYVKRGIPTWYKWTDEMRVRVGLDSIYIPPYDLLTHSASVLPLKGIRHSLTGG